MATILQSDMLPPGDGRVPVFSGPVITQVFFFFFFFFDHAVRLVGSYFPDYQGLNPGPQQ